MPFYFPLKHNCSDEEAQRAARNLLRLRQQLRQGLPPKTANDTLMLGTWNLRDFDSNKFGHGPRLTESLFYIAETISAFDIVAIQEVSAELRALDIVMRILGPDWDYIATDKTEGASGNNERMTFVFDTRKVRFQKIAGEVVLPMKKLVGGERQFARSPFLVAFQSGWFKFVICTVHIYYGSASGEKLERRIEEIDAIAEFLSDRADDESANYILLGDFNIVSPQHQTMQALTKHGFIIPEGLSASNYRLDKHYDQIAFKARAGQVKFSGKAGVFNLYETLFTEGDRYDYYPLMRNKDQLELDSKGLPKDSAENIKYYLNVWRTFQISDHLPMWVELNIDFAEEYLRDILQPSYSYKPEHPLSFGIPELDNYS